MDPDDIEALVAAGRLCPDCLEPATNGACYYCDCRCGSTYCSTCNRKD